MLCFPLLFTAVDLLIDILFPEKAVLGCIEIGTAFGLSIACVMGSHFLPSIS